MMKGMERIRIKPMVRTFRSRNVRKVARKPSIKITVSADLPSDFFERAPSPETVIKRIMTLGCSEDGDDEAFTKIVVDDSVVDFPNCIDFGIKDFLCSKDEVDLEISSDTDASYLEAAPPHRFSDSELESHIEIMSITLDNALKLQYPRRSSYGSPTSKNNDDLIFNFDIHKEDKEESKGKFDNLSNTENEKQGNRVVNGRPRPFRRHISLPASIFMTYLMAEKKEREKRNSLFSERSNRSNNSSFRKNDRFASRKLAKIDGSCSSNESSTEVEDNDTNDRDHDSDRDYCEDLRNKQDDRDRDYCEDLRSKEDKETEKRGRRSVSPNSSISGASEDSRDRNTPSINGRCSIEGFISSGSADDLDYRDDQDQEEQPFTSEIEKKSLVLRYMRRLVRQDTSGNFAPPDYCI